VINHGINPATTPGTATKNRTEPRTLIAFDIATLPSTLLKCLVRITLTQTASHLQNPTLLRHVLCLT
jgi:hypothetical protein